MLVIVDADKAVTSLTGKILDGARFPTRRRTFDEDGKAPSSDDSGNINEFFLD
jgi:hypothetical protein